MKNTLLAVPVAVGLMLGVGCGTSGGDDQIATNVKAALYSDQTTKPANIAVAVKDRQVTLSGDVPSSDVALEAMKVANGTPGVKGVTDQMTINGASANSQLPDVGNSNTAPPPSPTAQNAPPPPPPGSEANPYGNDERMQQRHEQRHEASELTVPAGDQISIRTTEAIDSQSAQAGQTFRGTVAEPVRVNGRVAIPAGVDARLEIAQNTSAGRIAGRPVLEVRLISITDHGERYRVDSSLYQQTGGSRTRQTAIRTGIGAAAGAAIGAIAGHGKGAAIGSLAGGGAGFGSDFFTKGPRLNIPSESVIAFTLRAPLTIRR